MRAAVLWEQEFMEIREQPSPLPSSGEVLIKVRTCGICGTDQHIYHGHPGSAEVQPPVILGHEFAGEITALGERVVGLNVGDRVSIDPNIYCGNCEYCRNGKLHLCNSLQAAGVTRDGGMAEFCTVPASNCYKIPDQMSFAEAALIEPLGCVLHGFRKLDIRPHHKVLVVGGGFIGKIFLQLVRNSGASRITVSEPAVFKHEMLLQLGADEVISPADSGSAEWLESRADIVIECVGRRESVELAVRTANKGGQILLFGVAAPETEVTIKPFDIFSKELRITSSFINPFTHEDAIEMVCQGKLQLESLISHRFTLEEVPDAMRDYPKLGVSKGVIEIG